MIKKCFLKVNGLCFQKKKSKRIMKFKTYLSVEIKLLKPFVQFQLENEF